VRTCALGKFRDENNVCKNCWPGTYKNDVGDHNCYVCQLDSTSETGSESITDCMCNSGYTFGNSANTCSACKHGKYKASSGNVACDSCIAGKYSTVSAATSENMCQQCRTHSTSDEASGFESACICKAGYSGQFSDICIACEPGKYKPISANMNCYSCPSGFFSTATAATSSNTCQGCNRMHSTTAVASDSQDDCVCNVGYTGTDTCSACTPGKYKASMGNGMCDSCMPGKYSYAIAARADNECRPCKTDSTSAHASDSQNDCMCNAGYSGQVTNTCSACVAGKYKNSSGNGNCDECMLGKYSTEIAALS